MKRDKYADAHWKHIVDVHRLAIEAGGGDALPLAVITIERCMENNRPRPEWLDAVLADWAAAHLTGDAAKLAKWPEPKDGRRARRGRNAAQLKRDLDIRRSYEFLEAVMRIGKNNNSQLKGVRYSDKDYDISMKRMAQALGIPKSTLNDALTRTDKYAKELSIIGPDNKQSKR